MMLCMIREKQLSSVIPNKKELDPRSGSGMTAKEGLGMTERDNENVNK